MFRTSFSLSRLQLTVYFDDGRIQGGRSRDLVTGPRGSGAPNRICKSANEQSGAKLLCFRSRDVGSNMGDQTISLLSFWQTFYSQNGSFRTDLPSQVCRE